MMNETIIKIEPACVDARGKISNILEEPITHVAIITSKKGTTRANHYHPQQTQYCYVVRGEFISYSKDLNKPEAPTESVVVKAGCLIITPPMIAHAMKFAKNTTFLNLTTGGRDAAAFNEHTIKYELA